MFKKRANRPTAIRQKRNEDAEAVTCIEEADDRSTSDDNSTAESRAAQRTIGIQKLRKRKPGVSHVTLASGKMLRPLQEHTIAADLAEDPFRVLRPEFADALAKRDLTDANMKASNAKTNNDDGRNFNESIVGTQFSRETRLRDEDEEMRKFIESELKVRRNAPIESDGISVYKTPDDKALESLPVHLRNSRSNKNEDMLSSQMLSGIPEVDLGIEEKIRNISATERARQKMEAERSQRLALKRSFNESAEERECRANDVNFHLAVRPAGVQPVQSDAAALSAKDKGTKATPVLKEVVTHRVHVGENPIEDRKFVDASDSAEVRRNKASDEYLVGKFKQQFHRK